MYEPIFPDWGAEQPPEKRYEKQYVTGPAGDMHAGEVLDTVTGVNPAEPGATCEYQVLRCHPCVGIHLWPLSHPDDLARYYREQFYTMSKPNYLADYAEDKKWWLAIHGTVLDAARPWLPNGLVTMLDIGAGPGYPLDVGAARGYDTTALEPSPIAAACLRERGHEVCEMTLEAFMGTDQRACWDVLYAWEVLEHSPEPENFLLHCYDLLRPGGVLVVAVPSEYTEGQMEACRRFNLPPWFLSAPEHQQYFTPATLKLMTRRCGLKLRYMRMSFPLIEHFILEQGKNYIGNDTLGRTCHQERAIYELDMVHKGRWPELEATYIANVEKRVGREIIGIFTKEL